MGCNHVFKPFTRRQALTRTTSDVERDAPLRTKGGLPRARLLSLRRRELQGTFAAELHPTSTPGTLKQPLGLGEE